MDLDRANVGAFFGSHRLELVGNIAFNVDGGDISHQFLSKLRCPRYYTHESMTRTIIQPWKFIATCPPDTCIVRSISIRMIFALSLIVCMEIYGTWMAHTISGKFRCIRWNPWAKCVSSNNKIQFNYGCSIHTLTHSCTINLMPCTQCPPCAALFKWKNRCGAHAMHTHLSRWLRSNVIWLAVETRAIFPLPHCNWHFANAIVMRIIIVLRLHLNDRDEIVDACLCEYSCKQ